MTKILQALMQLESRAESPSAPPAAAAPQVESSAAPVAPTEPPAMASPRRMETEVAPRSLLLKALERQPQSTWTAPIAPAAPTAATPISRPVSEKKRALRRARKAADAAARALDTTAEIEALLSSLQPSVLECWSPASRAESVLLEELPLNLAALETTAALTCDQLPMPFALVNDQTPQVVRVVDPAATASVRPAIAVEVADLLAAFTPAQIDSFVPTAAHGPLSFLATSPNAVIPAAASYTVHVIDQTPEVIRVVEQSLALPTSASVPAVDLADVFAAFRHTQVHSCAPEDFVDVGDDRTVALAHTDPCAPGYVCDVNDQTPEVIRIWETPTTYAPVAAPAVDLADVFAAFQPTWVELAAVADFELPLAARSLLTDEPDHTGSAYVYDINDQTPQVIRVVENPGPRAVEFDELLAAFEHTLVDSYSPGMTAAHGIETAFTPNEDNSVPAFSIECRDQIPVVIEIPRIIEVPAPPAADLSPQIEHAVIDAWTPDDPLATDVYSIDALSHEISGDGQLVVLDQLPEVIFLDAVTEPVEVVATLPEVTTSPPVPSAPRTRPTRRSLGARQRLPKPPDQREAQMRTAVRGPRQRTIVAPSAWETTIRDEISAAPAQLRYAGLIERWQSLHRDDACRRLLVVSLEQHLAAADTVLPAAMLLAGQGSAVLVIDADEQAELTRRLNLAGSPGLCELLSPEDAHGETIHPTATPRLHVLPLGRAGISPLAIGSALPRVLGDLAEEYTWILVNGGHADAPLTQAFARACQGTYVAAPLPDINLPLARESLARLRNAGARVLGSIVME